MLNSNQLNLIFKLNFFCITFRGSFFGTSLHSDQYMIYEGKKPQYLAKASFFLIKLKVNVLSCC